MFARPQNLNRPLKNSEALKGSGTSVRSRRRSPEAIEKLDSKPYWPKFCWTVFELAVSMASICLRNTRNFGFPWYIGIATFQS
jgi:hypothetical protein